MKTLLIFAILTTSSIYAQTNIIAAKSHASSDVIDPLDTDNFGDPAPMRFIQQVEYLSGACIIETYNVQWGNSETEIDTVCDHPFLQENATDVERIKAMYPEGTNFVGFEKLNTDQGNGTLKVRKDKRSKKSNAWWILLAGGGLFMGYLFIPKQRIATS